jgi:L-serine dehydratase
MHKISVFDFIKIGIGPSSSHTVGPMRASNMFIDSLKRKNMLLPQVLKSISIDLYGSLANTGKGHNTDKSIILGLEGYTP